MKHILIALLLSGFSCAAQKIDMDSRGMFVELKPVPITWLSCDCNITRLYVKPSAFAINTETGKGLFSYHWWLMYSDSTGSVFNTVPGNIGEGFRDDAINNIDLTYRNGTLGLFHYIVDSVGLDIQFK
jgi:hypothetical protein